MNTNLENINQFIHYLKVEKRYSENTLLAYQKDINQFSSFIEQQYELLFSFVKHIHIRSYIVELMNSNISNRSVCRKISSIKSLYKFLKKNNIVGQSPLANVQLPKVSKRLPSFVKQKEILLLGDRSFFPDDFFGFRDYLMIRLFYQTGMRLSELTNLKDSDINSDSIKVLGKRNKERLIPISLEFSKLIEQYKIFKNNEFEKVNEYLIVSDSGNKVYEKFVYRKVNYYIGIVSSIDKKSPHILRHTFATHMLNNGADLNAIKEILGHENLSATQVYTHNSFEKLKNIHEQAHPRG
ncbi:MAG: integrase [Crocinitomicaceae bacterium]|nr:integrase [Crocinitomicaceae bacterium]